MADSVYLLEKNFTTVIAIDPSDGFSEIAKVIKHPNLKTENIKIEDYDFPENEFNIINAQFSLPFIGKKSFEEVWPNIHIALASGGIFCGQLFGSQDTWNTVDSSLIFQTKKEVEDLISPFEIIFFEEIENDGVTATGAEKHWHFFNILLRKR